MPSLADRLVLGSPTSGVVVQTGTALAVNAGGGVRIAADEHWGIRTDAR